MHRALVRAAVDKHSPLRNVCLATLGSDGFPRQRILVLRRYRQEDGARFTFYTDSRSAKMEEVQKHPQGALHFWHPRQRLQIRAVGTMSWENQTERTREHWDALHVWGRKSYATERPPGSAARPASRDRHVIATCDRQATPHAERNAVTRPHRCSPRTKKRLPSKESPTWF